jgi:hypothetical protein
VSTQPATSVPATNSLALGLGLGLGVPLGLALIGALVFVAWELRKRNMHPGGQSPAVVHTQQESVGNKLMAERKAELPA